KASIGDWTHDAFCTAGAFAATGGTKAQYFGAGALALVSAGAPHGAPISIHRPMSAISPSFSLPEGGIFSVPDCITAFIKRLSDGLPGTTAGPRVTPLSRFSRLSIRSPPIPAAVEWQAWHWRANKDLMLVSKNTSPSSWASATA